MNVIRVNWSCGRVSLIIWRPCVFQSPSRRNICQTATWMSPIGGSGFSGVRGDGRGSVRGGVQQGDVLREHETVKALRCIMQNNGRIKTTIEQLIAIISCYRDRLSGTCLRTGSSVANHSWQVPLGWLREFVFRQSEKTPELLLTVLP